MTTLVVYMYICRLHVCLLLNLFLPFTFTQNRSFCVLTILEGPEFSRFIKTKRSKTMYKYKSINLRWISNSDNILFYAHCYMKWIKKVILLYSHVCICPRERIAKINKNRRNFKYIPSFLQKHINISCLHVMLIWQHPFETFYFRFANLRSTWNERQLYGYFTCYKTYILVQRRRNRRRLERTIGVVGLWGLGAWGLGIWGLGGGSPPPPPKKTNNLLRNLTYMYLSFLEYLKIPSTLLNFYLFKISS